MPIYSYTIRFCSYLVVTSILVHSRGKTAFESEWSLDTCMRIAKTMFEVNLSVIYYKRELDWSDKAGLPSAPKVLPNQ